MTAVDHFALLKSEIGYFKALADKPGPLGFLGQEVIRFSSIAGTLRENDLLTNASVDERFITHILARSLIENFFWLVYIFDDSSTRQSRYDELINSFKIQYLKLYNEGLSINASISTPDPNWKSLSGSLDVKSMLGKVKNAHGNKLDFLYPIYRITSFDTHGKSLNNVITAALGGASPNFPVLDLTYGFDLIANHYLCTLQDLIKAGEA